MQVVQEMPYLALSIWRYAVIMKRPQRYFMISLPYISRLSGCRVSSVANGHGVQISTWTELPREVIEIVMKDMSRDDCGLVETLAVAGPLSPKLQVFSNL